MHSRRNRDWNRRHTGVRRQSHAAATLAPSSLLDSKEVLVDYIVELDRWRDGPARRQLVARLPAWAQHERTLARFGTPQELFTFLESPPSTERDEAFCALLRLARDEQLAGEVVLSALLPGLKALVGSLLHDANARDDVWSSVLSTIWELIVTYPLERRPTRVAANLLLDTRKQTVKDLVRERERSKPTDALELRSGRANAGSVDLLVTRAVRAGAISRPEGRLILATRIDGRLLRAYVRLGFSYRALVMRRWRAEKRLLLFAGQIGCDHLGCKPAYLKCSAGSAGVRRGSSGEADRPTSDRTSLKAI
jgi:hypothetical protein